MKSFIFAAAVWWMLSAQAQAAGKPKTASSPDQADGIVSSIVDQLWDQNDVYWHHGDYPRIIALDRIITEADPQFLEAYATGGWLMESLNRNKDAETYYTLGVTRNPTRSYTYYNLGMFYYNTEHDYPAALAVFKHESRVPDAGINDWKMLAHTYDRLHEYDNSVAVWRVIQKRWPKGIAVDVNLAREIAKQKAAASSRAVNSQSTPGAPLHP